MRTLLLITLFTLLSNLAFAGSFDQGSSIASATLKAIKVTNNADKLCAQNHKIYTSCLKNLQMQAMEKKIIVLEQTLASVTKLAPANEDLIMDLRREINYETKYLKEYRDRAFDGIDSFETDLKFLFNKRDVLEHVKNNAGTLL